MTDYKGKEPIVIIGLGATGLSCIDFFRTRGITPRVMDTRFLPPGLNELPSEVTSCLGRFNKQWLLEAKLIVTTPGMPLSCLAVAENAGIEIIGDIELFGREATSPVVAITGSNGKSTVTRLLEEMATCAGWQVGVGGNIGLPALMLLKKPCKLYILELSSFQLETTHNLKTSASTVLNISQDHMDRYPLGLKQYRDAKHKIYQQTATCIINAEDPLTLPPRRLNTQCISFGGNSTDYYLKNQYKKTWLTERGKPLLNCAEMKIGGHHNYNNALAALSLAETIAIPRQACLKAIRQFRGLEHRFELVHQRNGVRWINDSKATNIGSTKAALTGIKVEGKLYLLLGGDSKLADLSPLLPFVQDPKIQLYCFGQDGKKLMTLRPEASTLTDTLTQAMHLIASKVREGDLVLLSPACASLDQFKNFEARGHAFTKLALEVG